jgi:hypothetical protein
MLSIAQWLVERLVPTAKMIHRESSRVSVLNHSGYIAVLRSSASEKCCLTTPSLLSRATQAVSESRTPADNCRCQVLLKSVAERLDGCGVAEYKVIGQWMRALFT